ncbi:MAG: PspC domain-containing protein [Actinomycetota bacterium]|nr:PspC domain-containing protein [Actinomycetota bacterium]
MVPSLERRDHVDIRQRHIDPRHSASSPQEGARPWCGPRLVGPGRAWSHRRREHGPLRRRRDDRLLGGIAGILAARTGLDVTIVRVGLVIFGLASGVGVAAYVMAWLLVPGEGEPESIGARALRDRRGLAATSALVPALLLGFLLASVLRAGWIGSLSWPAFVSAAGLLLIWRNGSDSERALLRRVATPVLQVGGRPARSWAGLVWRVALGVTLAGGGVAALTLGRHNALLFPLVGLVLVLAAFVAVFGPWWLGIGRDLVMERQARLRAEESANLATRVHDSVLQTLAMIQRHADDPHRVAQLARAQERELRSWLFEGRPPGSFDETAGTVATVASQIQGQVEAAHGVRVELVVVGDCPLNEQLEALLAAGREATVNSAKWSGAEVVSLYVEVEAARVSMFVRDRGRGFDPSTIDPDRQGIAQSVVGRMTRAGGCAEVRSAPGQGTEIELTMPRAPDSAIRGHTR